MPIRRVLPCVVITVASLLVGSAAEAQSAVDSATRRLLDRLDERQMPDVALWVLDRADNDPAISAELKATLSLRRAAALVATTASESDVAKRSALLDRADGEIDRFLATGPEGRSVIDAYTQKGNLFIQRGRGKVDQSKRPGEDPAPALAEAVRFFDAAIAALQGTVKPGEPVEQVKNAEDAVLKALREVDAKIAEIAGPPDDQESDGKKKPKKKPKRTAAMEKALASLEDEQEFLRSKLLQTRLMVGETYHEKSKAFAAGSPEWQAAIDESTRRHAELAEKYPGKGVGVFARFYQGRNLALVGKRTDAVNALVKVLAIDSQLAAINTLKAKALGVAVECWTAENKLDQMDESMLRFALTPHKTSRPDPDWLTMKYRVAAYLDAYADTLPPTDKARTGILRRDAKRLATEVATANKDFAKEARDLAGKLGKNLPADMADDKTFETVSADGRVALAALQEKQAAATALAGQGKKEEADALLQQAAADRDAALAAFDEAITLAGDEEQGNYARYMRTFLLYDKQAFRDAAEQGTMLAERYPNAKGSRQAAKIAMAAWQQLARQSDPAIVQEAKAKLVSLAQVVARIWPADAEGAEAFTILLGSATEAHDPAAILAIVQQVPAASPKRPEILLRAGAALWREVQEKARLDEAARPPQEQLAAWKAAAKAALDEGLAAVAAAPPTKITVAAALSRAQLAIDEGDGAKAQEVLEHAAYGPWTVVTGPQAALAQGPLAEGALIVALRYFVETQQLDKAQRAMDELEKLAGQGDEASAKLTAMYLSMGRDLQAQLERLGASGGTGPEVKARAEAILAGFEKFLDGLAKRDEKTSSRMWVATTYLTLGSGQGTGAVVAKAKAQQYLDRAADVFAALLARKDDPQAPDAERTELARFEPSIRLRMASIFRERGKWEQAQEQIEWILSDAKRQTSLETQVQAAELLQGWGEALSASDVAGAEQRLREATVGRKTGGAVIWGWGTIANKLSRQASAVGDEKLQRARDLFFEARLAIAKCLLERAQLAGKSAADKADQLKKAETAIATTRKLYPELGGEVLQARFEKLLKEIQKEQGATSPKGFADLDAQAAATAAP